MALWQAFCFGFGAGAGVMWWHFARCRLIRTRHEWYRDPVIAARYPDDAREALSRPDSW